MSGLADLKAGDTVFIEGVNSSSKKTVEQVTKHHVIVDGQKWRISSGTRVNASAWSFAVLVVDDAKSRARHVEVNALRRQSWLCSDITDLLLEARNRGGLALVEAEMIALVDALRKAQL